MHPLNLPFPGKGVRHGTTVSANSVVKVVRRGRTQEGSMGIWSQ
jgi:hypothetical protein